MPSPAPSCDWLDFGCKINEAVDGWFTSLVVGAIEPAFVMVGHTLLSSPPPSMLSRVQELSGHVQLVANALLVLFVLAGGLIVMAHGSVQTSTAVKEVAPRLVVATIALNTSLILCQHAVEFCNALVGALLGSGVDGRRAGNLLAGQVGALVADPEGTVLFLVLMAGVAVLMGIILAFIAVVRIALLLFLIIAAPLALLCHALPQTEGVAKLWWRAITGVLAIQVLQALVLILGFKVFLTDAPGAFALQPGQAAMSVVQPTISRAVDVLVLIGLFYVLIKIPGWVARSIWRQAHPTLLTRVVKALIIYKTLGAVGRFRGGRSRPGSAGTAVRPAPGRRNPVMPKKPASTSVQKARQLELPLGIPKASRDRQLALPFPVTRVARPPASAAPPPADTPWIRPRPPYAQDRLPGMPTRPARPRQLQLRLDPPPRRRPRGEGR
ncbi:type IV secretion system protein [Spongiactinospora sp. TRM90649]|uniref:type IV secretion system protein n=1 Tax=Spongiactinospora sp. TRM90649 TaxID=3031114 RepID=UPI0023F7D760|nr:type IV secretion system protein [Spongiactinospora sp. TRM90649]MDF5758801.1 hypothetical protein [Spongiactinospora sp. TRM90649]